MNIGNDDEDDADDQQRRSPSGRPSLQQNEQTEPNGSDSTATEGPKAALAASLRLKGGGAESRMLLVGLVLVVAVVVVVLGVDVVVGFQLLSASSSCLTEASKVQFELLPAASQPARQADLSGAPNWTGFAASNDTRRAQVGGFARRSAHRRRPPRRRRRRILARSDTKQSQ